MTMSEKLIALAEEHEAKAQALRLAAAEMNGHETATKQRRMPTIVAAAITARNGHRAPDVEPASEEDRARPVILAALANAPQTAAPILRALAATGITWTSWKLRRRIMQGMPGIRLSETRRQYERTDRRSATRLVPTQSKAQQRARLIQKMTILADILEQQAGKPMGIKDLSAAARAQGIEGLTGIRGLVDAGYLKQHGTQGKFRYSLKARPKAAQAAPDA